MYTTYFIASSSLETLAKRLAEKYLVFAPVERGPLFTKECEYSYAAYNGGAASAWTPPYRAIEPLKNFFTPPLEKVSEYFSDSPSADDAREVVLFGVKGCDLAGHKVQDFVYLEGVEVDALYRMRRSATTIISGDCTDFKSVCHCLAWEIMPYPVEGFDLNLSGLSDGYLAEVGSKKGEALVAAYPDYFTRAKETQVGARRAKRDALVERLKKHLFPQHLVSKNAVQELMRRGYHADTWQTFMKTCVECGGCNFICDTCHCFLLADKQATPANEKMRMWDSCQYANYARVAGGANPNKTRAARLRFRFTKKFDFFVDTLGMPACCGCGRCIEVCPGKIDIREVLKDVAQKASA